MEGEKGKEKKPKVLIIDDNRNDLFLFKTWFEEEGCGVIVTSNSFGAKRFVEDEVDIVLIDVMLGKESGIDLANQITDRHPDIIVILMTGFLRAIYCAIRKEVQCIEKTSDKDMFVSVVMQFWRQATLTKELEKKKRCILKQLPSCRNQIKEILREQKSPGLESLTGRIDDDLMRRYIKWIVYRYPDYPDIINICLAVLYGCWGKCRPCLSGLVRENAMRLSVRQMIGQVVHAFDSKYADGYLEDKEIYIRFTCEGDFIFNWRKILRTMLILYEVKDLNIPVFIVSTIGNDKVIRRFTEEYTELQPRLPVKLYWSAHSLVPSKREWLLRATKGQSIEKNREVFANFARISGQKVTIQWLLIKGFNDSNEDIEQIQQGFDGWWQYFDFKVMPYADKYMAEYRSPTSIYDAQDFCEKLLKKGVPARARINMGVWDGAGMGGTVPKFGDFISPTI